MKIGLRHYQAYMMVVVVVVVAYIWIHMCTSIQVSFDMYSSNDKLNEFTSIQSKEIEIGESKTF